MMVQMYPTRVFFTLEVPPKGPKIPNFDREYIENAKSQRYMSNGV